MQYKPILLNISSIKPNPFQPRKYFSQEDIIELANSIKQHGLIQPISVREMNDSYVIIAGERRFRACIEAGLNDIPAIVFDMEGVDIAEVSLIENIQRKDLTCIEEANAILSLKTKFSLTQEEISERLGKSRSYIANLIRLLDLPQDIIDEISRGIITMGHGRALLSLPNPEAMRDAFVKIVKSSLSVRQTESLVNSLLNDKKAGKKKIKKSSLLSGEASKYLSQILSAIKEIESEGGKADVIEKETEDYFELIVKIPKDV